MNTISESRKKFGERVKEQRNSIGMTMDELAKLMEFKHRSSVGKLESGENSIPQDKIEQLAISLKTNVAYLMGWNESLKGLSQDEFKLIMLYRNATDYGKALAIGNLQASQQDTDSAAVS